MTNTVEWFHKLYTQMHELWKFYRKVKIWSTHLDDRGQPWSFSPPEFCRNRERVSSVDACWKFSRQQRSTKNTAIKIPYAKKWTTG